MPLPWRAVMLINWNPLFLSLELALSTTLVLLLVCLPLALSIHHRGVTWGPLGETLVSLPLVLPPTVLGFYILVLLSPQWGPGAWLSRTWGIQLLFSFPGMLIASCLYTFPFMLNPLRNGLEKIPRNLLEASATLGRTRSQTTREITLPLLRSHIVTAMVTTFAHTMGEFGVILLVGGSIPGRTKVASIYIFELVENLDFSGAHRYSLILLIISFSLLFLVQLLQPGRKKS